MGTDSPEAMAVRGIGKRHSADATHPSDPTNPTNPTNPTDPSNLTDQQRWALYAPWLDHDDPAVRANALICLINQANYLLDKQIVALEAQFIQEGGYSEQLATARLAERNRRKGDPSNPTDPSDSIPPLARSAANPWRCARPKKEKTRENNSGAAPVIRIVKVW